MSIRTNIKQFWKTFLKEEAALRLAYAKQEHEDKIEYLQGLSRDLFGLELDIEHDGEYFELTFLPLLDKNRQLIAQALKDHAPAALVDFWIINAYRQPLAHKAFHTYVPYEGAHYDHSAFGISLHKDSSTKSFGIEVSSPLFMVLDEDVSLRIATEFLQLFTGDLYMQAYVSSIDVKGVESLDLLDVNEDLMEMLVERVDGIHDLSLEQTFETMAWIIDNQEWPIYHNLTEIYSVFKIEEDQVVEEVRHDMLFLTTTHEALISESLKGESEAAGAFFDLGGEFGYFVIENKYQAEQNALLKQTMEKQLQALLYPHLIARTIGGAIGVRYTYIDMAIFDKVLFLQALEKMQAKLSVQFEYHAFL